MHSRRGMTRGKAGMRVACCRATLSHDRMGVRASAAMRGDMPVPGMCAMMTESDRGEQQQKR